MIAAISEFLLILGSIFAAAQLFRQPEKLTEQTKTFAMLITLSLGFIAASALGEILLSGENQDSQTMARLLTQLKIFIAIPLISSLITAARFGYFFSRAAWGRWVLALFAMFELMRRMGLGVEYTQVLSVLCALSLLISLVSFPQPSIRNLGVVGALLISSSLLIYSKASLLPTHQHMPTENLMMAAGLIFIGLACRHMISYQQLKADS
jgi:hypothetical protein